MSSPWTNPREASYWAEKAYHKAHPGSFYTGTRDGLKVDIYIPKAIERIDRFFAYLASGGLAKIGGLAVFQLAKVAQGAVATRYRELASGQTRSLIGKLSFEKGKEDGGTPARFPRSEVSGFTQLANAIRCYKAGPPNTFLVDVDDSQTHMDPKKRYPAGVPLRLLAWWIENKTPSIIPVTTRMAVYLHLLREGRGGYGTRKTGRRVSDAANKPTGRYIVILPKDRPVWTWVVARLLSHGAQTQAVRLVRQEIERTKKQFGL